MDVEGEESLDSYIEVIKYLESRNNPRSSTMGFNQVIDEENQRVRGVADVNSVTNLEYTRILDNQFIILYTDENFPKDDNICGKDVIWKRLPEIYPEFTLLESIEPADVLQGQLGNCYFISALASLAKTPEKIDQLFVSKKRNSKGAYSIYLCDSGNWIEIIIDDFIPCIKEGDQYIPVFARANNNDVWVMLIEKAFAKLYGGYQYLDSGYLYEGYNVLTGAPTQHFIIKDTKNEKINEAFEFVKRALKKKDSLTAATLESLSDDICSKYGLIQGHAYSIIDLKENNTRFFILRNPWGKRTNQSNKLEEEDGVFELNVRDFCQYFVSICSCIHLENYKPSFLELEGTGKEKDRFFVETTIKDDGINYISIIQKTYKHFKDENYKYSKVTMKIYHNFDDQIFEQCTTSQTENRYFKKYICSVDEYLIAGSYIILIEVTWSQQLYRKLTFTTYSNADVCFTDITKNDLRIYKIKEGLFLK